MADDKKDVELDRMPGADAPEAKPEEAFDLNFGLDVEEPEQEEEAEETVAEAEEDVSRETPDEEVTAEADEEPEEEVEEEVAELEEEQQPEPKTKHKGQTVPKARMDEVIAERNKLRREIEEMQNAQKPREPEAPTYDFSSKEKEYQELVLDGETEKATALRNEINTAQRDQLKAELASEVETTINRKNEEAALQLAADKLQADYTVFNEDSSDYNQALTQEVIDLRDAFIIKGERPVDALKKASDFIIKSNNLGHSESLSDEPQGLAGNKAAPKKTVDEVAKKRAEVQKKLDAASKQPPELPGESSSNHGEKALDVSSLSEEEFAALPEATLRRLRGDIF